MSVNCEKEPGVISMIMALQKVRFVYDYDAGCSGSLEPDRASERIQIEAELRILLQKSKGKRT
jgi:hypothetical protein